jgi:hypothetical protein
MNKLIQSDLSWISTSDFEFSDFTHLFENEMVRKELEPWVINSLHLFDHRCIVPPSFNEFQQGNIYRLPNHNRSFCYSESPSEYQNTICIKGCEIFTQNFEENISNLLNSNPRSFGLSLFEQLLSIEQKIPSCLTYTEAIKEAKIAEELHMRYLEVYSELAPLPLPIKVYKLPTSICSEVENKFLKTASLAYFNDISSLLNINGLGIYIYMYPISPLRISNFNDPIDNTSLQERDRTLKSILPNPQDTINDWITLFIRVLCIGFIPVTTKSYFRGALCDPNNASIGGGFCDLGSIEKISDIYSDRILIEALQLSFDTLCNSILEFVSAHNARSQTSKMPQDYLKLWVYSKMSDDIKIYRNDLELHPIVSEYFNNNRNFQEMFSQFALFY